MSYRIRRVGLRSAARVGCWLAAPAMLPPALCLSALVVLVVQALDAAFRAIQPIELRLGPALIARLDLLDALRLSRPAQAVAGLADRAPLTFLVLTVLGLAAGILALSAAALLLAAAYNLLAAHGHGLEVVLERPDGS
jgi:hypothetical protein